MKEKKLIVLFIVSLFLLMSYTVAGLNVTKTDSSKQEKIKNDTYTISGHVYYRKNGDPCEGVKAGEMSKVPGNVGDKKYEYTDNMGYYCLKWDDYPGPVCITLDRDTIPESYTFSPPYGQCWWSGEHTVRMDFEIYNPKSKEFHAKLIKNSDDWFESKSTSEINKNLPDLIISSLEVRNWGGYPNVVMGWMYIKNIGNVVASADKKLEVKFIWEYAGVVIKNYVGNYSYLLPLGPGESNRTLVFWDYAENIEKGTKITAIVDANNLIEELDESNNMYGVTYESKQKSFLLKNSNNYLNKILNFILRNRVKYEILGGDVV
jgi:hypothetical protein